MLHLKYSNTPNGITNLEYSINVGIQNFTVCLKNAVVKNPMNIDNIKLALQWHNFRNGFISWAKERHGGYSKKVAKKFSAMMAKKNGWNSYRDVEYVAHIIIYYPCS